VKIDKSKTHSSAALKNGVCEEHFKDGTSNSVGEWQLYDTSGKLIKTTRHK